MTVPHQLVSTSGEDALVLMARVPVSVDIVVVLVATVAAKKDEARVDRSTRLGKA